MLQYSGLLISLHLKKREERWHAKEAWPTVSEREKMVCQRSTTPEKKRKRKDGVPKKHDPKKNGERSNQEWSCIHHPHCALAWLDSKHKYYLSMDPIFDFAIEVMQVCVFIFPTELHFSHPHTIGEEKASSGKYTHEWPWEIQKG